jgi:hypothetical protein
MVAACALQTFEVTVATDTPAETFKNRRRSKSGNVVIDGNPWKTVVAGGELRVAGCELLVASCWLLVAGCWLLI